MLIQVSNIELNDKRLSYILNDPFKTIVETKKKALSGSNSDIWCHMSDIFQTLEVIEIDNYKFNDLCKSLNLSGNLIHF